MTAQQIESLAKTIDLYSYAKERETGSIQDPAQRRAVEEVYNDKLDLALLTGIGDLDFDPFYYLNTGETSAEGWAR